MLFRSVVSEVPATRKREKAHCKDHDPHHEREGNNRVEDSEAVCDEPDGETAEAGGGVEDGERV